MTTNPVRSLIVEAAKTALGTVEKTRNQAPMIAEFWKATSYPDGMENREPWCAAFVCWSVRSAMNLGLQLATRPRDASVHELLEWAKRPENGCLTFGPSSKDYSPEAGDLVIFLPHFSHVGIVEGYRYHDGDGTVLTVEGNTNGSGSREGDGVYQKARALSICGTFVRLPMRTEAV